MDYCDANKNISGGAGEENTDARGVTSAQIALAWLHDRARIFDLTVVPIPGTRKRPRFRENVAAFGLSLQAMRSPSWMVGLPQCRAKPFRPPTPSHLGPPHTDRSCRSLFQLNGRNGLNRAVPHVCRQRLRWVDCGCSAEAKGRTVRATQPSFVRGDK